MSRVGYAIVGAAAAAYLTARAALVPITYDEAATLVRYVEGGVTAIFDFNVATNHWLNTALTWLSARVFGTAPWALRLPAVIAGFGFIVFAAAIARRAESTIVGISGFVLMVANPYLLDYLALSRGYGIALCLLTASLYYLLAWCDHAPDSPGARRALVRSVWLAAAAVLATFTVLPAFLALIAVVTGRLLWTAGPRRATTGAPPSGLASWRVLAAWLVVAAGVSLMVFSRQEVLSADLFTPISVRTVGLFAAENDQVRVFRVDAKGRVRPFERDGPDAWRSDPGRNAWSLRIELPVSVDRNLTSLEVTIGPRVFRRDRRKDGPWTAWDSGPDRLLRSTAALSAPRSAVPTVSGSINWGGDAGQWRLAARHTAVLVGFLAIGAALLAGVASLGTRAGWIDHGSAGVILSAVVAMAGLTAAPLYLLRRDAQLYFGGTGGLVADTFGSLVEKAAYGVVYTSHQVPISLACLALAAAGLVVSWARSPGRRSDFAGPLVLLALIVLIAIIVSAQHAILGTPWLTGRTALFLLPLISTFVVVASDAMSRSGARIHAIVATVMALLAFAAAGHTVRVANVASTLDWPDDAATPAMLQEVESRVDRTTPQTVRVGVQWMFYPAARYYAERMSDATTRYVIEVAPVEGPPPDFVYTAERLDPDTATLIGGFTGSPATLWRTIPGAAAR